MDAVSHANFFRQQVRVGNRPAKFAPALRLGAPVNAAITLNRLFGSVDCPRRVVIKQTIDSLVEDELADHPAAVRSVACQVGVLAGKELLMINNVAVLEPQQFFRECLRRLAG